jgi:hypothetical protein
MASSVNWFVIVCEIYYLPDLTFRSETGTLTERNIISIVTGFGIIYSSSDRLQKPLSLKLLGAESLGS